MTSSTPTARNSFLRHLFISRDEPRLRAFWRLAVQTILFLILVGCIGSILSVSYLFIAGKLPDGIPFLVLNEVILLAATTPSVFLARRLVDRRSLASLGLRIDLRSLLDLLAGVLIAFLLMGSIYLSMTALGWIRLEGFAWQTESIPALVTNGLIILGVFILTGWNEELLFRGYQLQTIASGTNALLGVILSSILFGVAHLTNQNSSWTAVLGIFFAGLLFAAAYLKTSRLWLPIGLHIGWNVFEGPLFGFSVSGMDYYHLLRNSTPGPTLWTGGAFGPEAGLIILPAIGMGYLLIILYVRLRSNLFRDP